MEPIPRWRGDADYFTRNDPQRPAHLREIEIHRRIDRRIDEAMCNGTYRVMITREEMA